MKIRKAFVSLLLTLMLLVCIPASGLACSTFMLKSNQSLIVGHNVDYPSDYMPGFLCINKRGITKTNFTLNDFKGKTNHTPKLQWTSKYGSVTFNVTVLELGPTSGINEMGLFIAEMALVNTKYPTDKTLPHMVANQWMQYQLDNYQSVAEVLDHLSQIVPENDAPNHYFISDQHGNTACIEYLKRKPVVYKGKSMPVPLLCNSEYKTEMKLLKEYEGFGGSRPLENPVPGTDTRFVQGAAMLKNYGTNPSQPVVDYGFDILTQMWRGSNKWAFVIDVSNHKVYFHTSRSRQVKYFSYQDVDFSKDTPVKIFDINSNSSGDVTRQFSNYTPQFIKYYTLERLKLDNPRIYNDITRKYIDTMVKRIRHFLAGIHGNKPLGREDQVRNSLVIKKLAPLTVVSIRDTLSAIGEQDKLWHELGDYLTKQKIAAAGAGFTIYHGQNGQSLELEVVIPVTQLGSDSGRVKFKVLDGVDEMASVTFQGPYTELPVAYAVLHQWLASHGYQITGPNREIWLRSGWEEKDPNEYLTEIQIPVKKQ